VRAGTAPLVLVHDDDDRLRPDFLAKTIAFLDEHQLYDGVVVQIKHIIETSAMEEVEWEVFNHTEQAIRLVDMADHNQFSPIGFLFRREAYEAAGGYDETVPVLEDWVFNLRFLANGDIGMIPELLAEYYWREMTDIDAAHGNSAVAGSEEHRLYDVLIRNRMLRTDLESGRFGVGWLVNPPHRLAASRVNEVARQLGKLQKVHRIPGRYLRNWFRRA
jgi:hypothetical protein